MDFYQTDLAKVHDAGYGDFARKASEQLLHHFRRHGVIGGTVVDLGCGSGIWAERLVEAGYRVFGVDYSEAMIALCRQKVPQGEFVRGSLLEVPLPPCQVVTSMSECFNYLFDDANNTDAGLYVLFRRVYDALTAGGLFVFDFQQSTPLLDGVKRVHFREAEDWSIISEATVSQKERLYTRHITLFYRDGDRYRRSVETHQTRLLDSRRLASQLREVGFKVHVRRGYGSFALPETHRVLYCKK